MDELVKQVRRAQWRLAADRFLAVLGWCWFAGLTAAGVVILACKYYPLGVPDVAWAAGGLGLGLVAAAAWAGATARRGLDAAIEIDRRYGLKERVSSALAMPEAERGSEAGQALLSDALRRVGRIDVAEKFRLRPRWPLLLPAVPAVVAAVLALAVPPAAEESASAADPPAAEAPPEVKKSAEVLSRRLADRRQEAEKQGLKDATELLKRLEQGAKELGAEGQRDKALVKLNDLSRELEERRRQLSGAEKIKQDLEQLRKVDKGPADKLGQALSRGDFQKAAKELQNLKDQLAASKLDSRQKEQLAKQLDEMQQKLDQVAKARKEAQADLQQRAGQSSKEGRPDEAGKLEAEIAKLLEQKQQTGEMQGMAEDLGECAKCLQQGQGEKAAQAMERIQAGLEKLQQQMEELDVLDGALEQLGQAREQMNCKKCGGAGCQACQGEKAGEGMAAVKGKDMGGGPGGREPGNQPGRGLGQGDRPEPKTETKFFDSRVPQQVGKGGGAVTGLAGGANIRGNVREELQQEEAAVRRGSTDPLSGNRLPKKHGEHAREYFERLREGK